LRCLAPCFYGHGCFKPYKGKSKFYRLFHLKAGR